jgi:hypothetical protein
MSTIVISNIKATGETASRAVSGVAAAHFGFNLSPTSAMGMTQNTLSSQSVNASSLTDSGTGDATITLTNAMVDTGYTFVSGAWYNNNIGNLQTANSTASSLQVLGFDADTSTSLDLAIWVAIHGDLA